MAYKKRKAAKRVFALRTAVVLSMSLILAVGVGFGVASANGDSSIGVTSFGIDSQSTTVSSTSFEGGVSESSVGGAGLCAIESRDISEGIAGIEKEEEEAARKAEEERIAAEQAKIEEARAAESQQAAIDDSALVVLGDVNWEVGEEEFVAEWTQRIDAYLAGSPLAGTGAIFAQAAWNNGVDPRWSPAIANTESSKGAICFQPYNAWGWGNSGWSSWEEAINAHVAGLASGYGYTISSGAASKYCPPNSTNWYNNTLGQMGSM